MPNPLARLSPFRQLLVIAVLVPTVVALAVLAFAWPASRTAPRDLPVGVIATGNADRVAHGLDTKAPGAFEVHRYPDVATARTAIEHRDIYGAFVVTPGGVTVLTAGAASPTVAQLLAATGQALEPHAGNNRTVDVVPTAPDDPRGTVISSLVLPLILGGAILAVLVGLVLQRTALWRKYLTLTVVSVAVGLGVYLVAQGWLGSLPGEHLPTLMSLSLAVLAVGSTVAGLCALLGFPGIAVGAALMIFVGNPFSGASSAPELLPTSVGQLGRWLPPGADVDLLRRTAYFHGHGAGEPAWVLAAWSLAGLVAVTLGHLRATAAAEPADSVEADRVVTRGGGVDVAAGLPSGT